MKSNLLGKAKILSHTLKFKLMVFLIILVIPLMVILYLNNYYSVKLADQQMNDYTTRILDNYCLSLDSKMTNVSDYLLRMCLSDAQNLNVDDRNDRFFYRQELHEELQKVIGFYDIAEGIFVYQEQYDEFARYTGAGLGYGEAEVISTYIKSHLSDILAKDAQTWNTVTIHGEDYFFYTLKAEDTYIGAWVSVSEIMEQILGLQMGNVVSVEFVGADGAAAEADSKVTDSAEVEFGRETSVNVHDTYDVSVYLKACGMNVTVKLETVPIYQLLSNFQKIIIAASVIIVLLLLCSGLIYRKYIFMPMRQVENAIAQVEQGNWDYRLEEKSTSMEFERIDKNFNSMAGEIRNLKIDIYEEEIQRQKVELEYLHYQIKPHFILNVINTINSMAQIKETGLIQKMTQYLSGYVRYTFRRENSMVTIREELENVKNYLGMQLLRFPDSLECEIDMETRVMDIKIPAMTMMTFVENIIKHAFDMYACTTITLKARMDAGEQIHLIIKDSGIGFSEEAMDHIMHCAEISEGGKQVGIVNIKKRLKLIYGETARIIASNDNGAKIEIILPAASESENEGGDEK